MEALFYDMSNNADKTVAAKMQHDDFAATAKTFFTQVSQMTGEQEAIDVMRSIEPYMSRWEETLKVLGIEER